MIYENTDQKETTRLGGNWEWETRVVVERQGNFTRSGLDVIDETEIFEGGENNLMMGQTYTHDFQYSYDFSMYPFDTQVRIELSQILKCLRSVLLIWTLTAWIK